jgi:hypothetical protein
MEDPGIVSLVYDLSCIILDMYPTSAFYARNQGGLALSKIIIFFPLTLVQRIVDYGILLAVSHQVEVTEAVHKMYHHIFLLSHIILHMYNHCFHVLTFHKYVSG